MTQLDSMLLKQISKNLHLTDKQTETVVDGLLREQPLANLRHTDEIKSLDLSFQQCFQSRHLGRMPLQYMDSHDLSRFVPHDTKFLQFLTLPLSLNAMDLAQWQQLLNACFEDEQLDLRSELLRRCPEVDEGRLEQMISDLGIVLLSLDTGVLTELRAILWEQAVFKLSAAVKLDELLELQKTAVPLQKMTTTLLWKYFYIEKKLGMIACFEHPQGENWVQKWLVQRFSKWIKFENMRQWLEMVCLNLWKTMLHPLMARDLRAILYDRMVEQSLGIIEHKLRQVLWFRGVGERPLLLFYPYGRAGVMLLAINELGYGLDSVILYPNAADYDVEQTIGCLAKLIIKYQIEDLVLLLKPETQKILIKNLLQLKQRYLDLSWQLHVIPKEFAFLFQENPNKQPNEEQVLAMARWAQVPMKLWQHGLPEQICPDTFKILPRAMLKHMWQELCWERLMFQGVDVNHASLQVLSLVPGLNDELMQQLIAGRPYQKIPIVPELSLPYLRVDSVGLEGPQLFGWGNYSCCETIPAGTVFWATVTNIMTYGVFVALAPGIEGLLHVSEMGCIGMLQDLALLFKPGDMIVVAWLNYDKQQRRLSFRLPVEVQMKKSELQYKKGLRRNKPEKVENPVLVQKSGVAGAMQMAFEKLKKQTSEH